MALNPKTIKALFGKLSPYVDDAAKYGAPKFVHGTDAVTKDMYRILKGVDPDALPVKNAGNVLKKALDINPSIQPSSYIETNPSLRDYNQKFWTFHKNAIPPKAYTTVPETVSKLGDDVLREGFTRTWENPTSSGISLPAPLPTKELVVSGESVLPHSNTALGRYYRSRMSKIDTIHKNPPLEKLPTFRNAAEYDEFINYLDTEDMLKRVKDATYGSIPGVSEADTFAYVKNLPTLDYADPKSLEYLHDKLSKRYASSKKLQSVFGHAPSSFASNDEYENALATLLDELQKTTL